VSEVSVAVDASAVAGALRERLDVRAPAIAIVLGSGLGGLAKRVGRARSVRYADIPGFAAPAVEGHAGLLIAGELAGREALVLAGRFHLYEGHPPAAAGFPVRVASALGAQVLLVSNAAGGIRRTFRTGDLMVINDHINLMWRNPLTGPVVPGDDRFPDMSCPYDSALRVLLHESAASLGEALQDGVYAGLMGPSYETPAEIRMLERLGVDAVGMSTVPEVLVARALGLRVAGVSCITNPAAGLSAGKVDHADVLERSAAAAERFEHIVIEFVRRLDTGDRTGRRP
jgi:purine-nucleoside phosphorylase